MEETFRSELQDAFSRGAIREAFELIAIYFGEYDSFVKLELIPLFFQQAYILHCKKGGLISQYTLDLQRKKISQVLNSIIINLTKEKHYLGKQDPKKMLWVLEEIRKNLIHNPLTAFEKCQEFGEKYHSYYYAALLDALARRVEMSEKENINFVELNKVNFEILRWKDKIQKELTDQYNKKPMTSEMLLKCELLAKGEISEVLFPLIDKNFNSNKAPSYQNGYYWYLIELYIKHRNLERDNRLGLIEFGDYVVEMKSLIAEILEYR